MVILPMVASFCSTCGASFEVADPFGDLPPLSPVCGWPPGANGSPSANGGASRALGLKILRVRGKEGRTDPRSGLGRPAQAHFGPVRSPHRFRGFLGDYALCPFHLHDFDDVILASMMEVLFA
jgi:hypothetical protein